MGKTINLPRGKRINVFCSSEVIVEATDPRTGETLRCSLPFALEKDCLELDELKGHAFTLLGEDEKGNPQRLVAYTTGVKDILKRLMIP